MRRLVADAAIAASIPVAILIHLIYAPYTKVEESFNIQATHDILNYGIKDLIFPTEAGELRLKDHYDHLTFTGPVPRTFVGALALAGASWPLTKIFEDVNQQLVDTQAGSVPRRSGLRNFVIILTATGVVFRSELALLLMHHSLFCFINRRLTISSAIISGCIGAAIGLALTVPIDSIFWRRFPLWPELSAFGYNILQSQSSNWGTSPWHFYFSSALPRLLFNPLIYILCLFIVFTEPGTRRQAINLVFPSIAYVILYSAQPHKEWRFIIYVIPSLLTAAALGAHWIWIRQSKALVYRILSLALVASVIGSFGASGVMLAISRLNYPGAHALNRLHELVPLHQAQHPDETLDAVHVHMDVLSCMTGVTRFLQRPSPDSAPGVRNNKTLAWVYDKREDESKLLDPLFWQQFDWVLAERVERVIGRWEVVETIQAYAGVRIISPNETSHTTIIEHEPREGKGAWRKVLGYADLWGRKVSGGWWVDVKLEPSIRVLKRQRDDAPVMVMGGDCWKFSEESKSEILDSPGEVEMIYVSASCLSSSLDSPNPRPSVPEALDLDPLTTGDIRLARTSELVAIRLGKSMVDHLLQRQSSGASPQQGPPKGRAPTLVTIESGSTWVDRSRHTLVDDEAWKSATFACPSWARRARWANKFSQPQLEVSNMVIPNMQGQHLVKGVRSKSTPGSRSNSPGAPSRRIQKLNSYLSKMASQSTDNLTRLSEPMSNSSEPVQTSITRRWDGARRTTTNWDSIRRDPELWFPTGDCLVHFYAQGQSRRGASLRVSLAAIETTNCAPLLKRYSAKANVESPSTASDHSSSPEEEYFPESSPSARLELFVAAPAGLTRDESFQYHLTTRNFFAWMFQKPLVGDRLGDSLLLLLDRMNEFRSNKDENLDDMLAYLDAQEYADFRSCPDHALAVLRFAEKNELLELWRDSFCHCAGMADQLPSSGEFELYLQSLIGLQLVSRQSKALITRAHLEMDLRLEHAGRSLGNFLEDDLSGDHFGLSPVARAHLDRFRSFLHSFYVARHGYWPPTRVNPVSAALPKSTFKSMYFEFRNLYAYLLDPSSSPELPSNRVADGGICVFQNIAFFEQRRKYASLPHPLPLVPELPPGRRRSNTVWKLFKQSSSQRAEKRNAALAALSAATNPGDPKVMECSLVREYIRFEKSWTLQEKDESVPCSDARKIRWILIYAVLQTLISVTRAPPEVRDTEGVPYPLCCQIAGTPPWDEDGKKAAQKKLTLKEKLVARDEKAMLKPKPQQEIRDGSASQTQPVAIPTAAKVAFTTHYLEIQPDHANLFIPKVPAPLFSSSFPNALNNSFRPPISPPPQRQPPPPPPAVPSTSTFNRPHPLTLTPKVSVGHELSVRSPQPKRPGAIKPLIKKYSRERLPISPNASPSSSKTNSRNNSAPSSGNSSPGGAISSSRRGNSSPVNTNTPLSSSARESDSSAWSASSVGDDDDGMEHRSISGVSVSSVYDDVLHLDDDGLDGKKMKGNLNWKGGDVKRWDSVRSVAQLGRSNPEVDHYVFGIAR
ncbi:MAG: hypothetical protein Q9203_000703 [Teloschistes exilis]